MKENPKSGFSNHERLGGYFMFTNSFDSTEGRWEKEVWAYPTISFIADIGGSLGLFIGFSFLSVWDFWEYVFDKYKQYRT